MIQDSGNILIIDVFLEPDQTHGSIRECGQKILLKLYKAKNEENSNGLRFSLFRRKNLLKITDNNVKNKQPLADCKTLPQPMMQHYFTLFGFITRQVYYQIPILNSYSVHS